MMSAKPLGVGHIELLVGQPVEEIGHAAAPFGRQELLTLVGFRIVALANHTLARLPFSQMGFL